MILQYVYNTDIQYFFWVLQHTLVHQKYVHQKYVHQNYVQQKYVQQKYVQQKYVHQEFLSLDAELPKPTNLGSYKFRSFTCYVCDRQA